jgi:hypothetical protein
MPAPALDTPAAQRAADGEGHLHHFNSKTDLVCIEVSFFRIWLRKLMKIPSKKRMFRDCSHTHKVAERQMNKRVRSARNIFGVPWSVALSHLRLALGCRSSAMPP